MKNVVLCFDGTDNKFGPAPFTNLIKVFRLLYKDDPTKQICYYQPGIGASMQIDSDNFGDRLDGLYNTIDSLIAFSLDEHIIKAYEYLMRFYEDGDKIYMFGFSRGGFTARVLCSMIERVGLLNAGLEQLVEGAWSIYSAWEYAAQPSQPDYTTTLVDEFRMTFSRSNPPHIEFLGLFDCVNSVGIVRDRMFPFSSRFKTVKEIRHAVSMDERRVKYKQSLIYPNPHKSVFKSAQRTPNIDSRTHSVRVSTSESVSDQNSTKSAKISEAKKLIKDLEVRLKASIHLRGSNTSYMSSSSLIVDKTKLLNGEYQELWFPGNHGDVGGGWTPDNNGQFISNLPLRWIISEAIKHGIFFRKQKTVEFAQRYSSLDSFLSCAHDVLSFHSKGLTHKPSSKEQFDILKITNTLAGNNKSVPYFKSCGIPNSVEELINGGHYMIKSLRQINFNKINAENITDYKVISQIFSHYKSLPKEKIAGNDGRGNNASWKTFLWWILELIPLYSKVEDENTSQWRPSYMPNLGKRRTLPKYAKLHWSIFWRMKYCNDYKPKNLPEYVKKLITDSTFKSTDDELYLTDNSGDDDNLLKRSIEQTKQNLENWELDEWSTVPDDLFETLEQFGYFEEGQVKLKSS